MPKSTNPAAYPFSYHPAFTKACDGEFRIPCPDKKAAKNLQLDMYGYRRALQANQDPDYHKFVQIKLSMEINLSGGYDLILAPYAHDPVNDVIMAALAESESASPATPTAEPVPDYPPDCPSNSWPDMSAEPENQPDTDLHTDTLKKFGYSSGHE